MLKRWIVLSFISGYIVLLAICVLIISRHNRYVPTEPLPLRTIAWQEIGTIRGIVDLDADRNDELIVQDKKGHWWWVKWGEKTQRREPLPVPAKAELFWFQEVWQDKCPEVLIFVSNKQGIVLTRNRKGWQKYVAKKVFKINQVALTDLDGDGHLDDALLVDGRHLCWLKREPDGTLYQQDRLTLLRPSAKVNAYQVDDWWECWAGEPFTLESGRLKWLKGKGRVLWTKADIDGDGRLDQVQWQELPRFRRLKKMGTAQETEVQVGLSKVLQTTSFKIPMSMPFLDPPLVCDMDGDGKAEIVAMVPAQHLFIQQLTYWRYDAEKGQWQRKSTQLMSVTFAAYGWRRGFMVEKDKKVSLLMLANAHQGVAVWRWRLEKGEWKGEKLGKLQGQVLRILDTGQNLFIVTQDTKPDWFWWIWEKLERWLNLKPLLMPKRLWVYQEGRGVQLLTTFPTKQLPYGLFFTCDFSGDGRQELIWQENQPLTVCIGDWDGQRWRVGKSPLPSTDWFRKGQLRNGKKGWLIYQHRTNHHCLAVTVQ